MFSTFLFLFNSIVFEKSFYVRMYAPLAFVTLVIATLSWELKGYFLKRKFGVCATLLVFIVALFKVTMADQWHLLHIPMMALGLGLLLISEETFLKRAFDKYKKYILYLVGVAFLVAPLFLLFVDIFLGSLGMEYVYKRTHFGYIDNLLGLARVLLTFNVTIFFTVRILKKHSLELGYMEWLLLIGVVSAVCLAIFTPHNHIYFSRFYHTPATFAMLGAGGVLSRFKRKKLFLVVFISFQIVFSFINLRYDRSNLKSGVQYLNQNLKSNDALLSFNTFLFEMGGEDLVKKAYFVEPIASQFEADKLIEYLENRVGANVYFFYKDHYGLRRELTRFFIGVDREPVKDLFTFLKHFGKGKEILKEELRGCQLVKIDRKMLIKKLRTFEQDLPKANQTFLRRTFESLKKYLPPVISKKIESLGAR
ncbi:hypothetical protein [Halobacteriovorax sp. HLS]|uniref:hypothetical protein n=1 Tax=Halobacteriovorax sp. HLS TaxID=2234000 RepID=UPI000FDB8DDB|nr:hypothetical protein [Halobacteriovorax sp. HLS]